MLTIEGLCKGEKRGAGGTRRGPEGPASLSGPGGRRSLLTAGIEGGMRCAGGESRGDTGAEVVCPQKAAGDEFCQQEAGDDVSRLAG